MPNYRYVCPDGHRNLKRSSIEERDEPKPCHGGREGEDCDKMAERDLQAEMNTKSGHVFEPDFFTELANDENPEGQYIKSRNEYQKAKDELNLRERDSFVE